MDRHILLTRCRMFPCSALAAFLTAFWTISAFARASRTLSSTRASLLFCVWKYPASRNSDDTTETAWNTQHVWQVQCRLDANVRSQCSSLQSPLALEPHPAKNRWAEPEQLRTTYPFSTLRRKASSHFSAPKLKDGKFRLGAKTRVPSDTRSRQLRHRNTRTCSRDRR